MYLLGYDSIADAVPCAGDYSFESFDRKLTAYLLNFIKKRFKKRQEESGGSNKKMNITAELNLLSP